MRKKALLMSASISMLLSLAVAGTQLVNLIKANPNPLSPWYDFKEGPPEYWARPPEISITSPNNNTIYTENSICLALTVNVDSIFSDLQRSYFIKEITYKADWLPKNKTVHGITTEIVAFSGTINLKDIPEGEHSIVVSAIARGSYERQTGERMLLHPIITVYGFNVSGSSFVTFSIDTVPPKVSISVPLNETYNLPDVPLNFAVSEKPSLIRYSLDGQKNLTLYRNTTLTELTYGGHNLTVYVWDEAGNLGIPETVVFRIDEPESFPTTLVVSSSASVALITGLLVYFRRRKR